MANNDFKIMFISINDRMRTVIPLNISYLSAAVKEAGFNSIIFDTSFYAEHERLLDEKKMEEAGIFKAVDYSSIGVKLNNGSLTNDMLKMIEKEKPNIIGFSLFSQSKRLNFKLASEIKEKFSHIPIIMGGIHVNVDPPAVLNLDYVDYICVGEGEVALVQLMKTLANGENASQVQNIGWKNDGEMFFNPLRPVESLDKLPFPDWDSFEPYHQYGPYRGKLLKMATVEFSRTCPHHCSYCGNKIIGEHYRNSGLTSTYRHKSPKRWVEELKWMKDTYGIEFLFIVDGTFLAQSEKNLEEVATLYIKEINLPFFACATVHCLTDKKSKLLKDMGCVCINMGLESGNEEYRKKYLDRTMSNAKIVSAFHMAKNAGLETRSYNIIGLPYETREDIFQTIELNKQCKVDSVSASIFMPYEGTKLRELCINEKLVDPNQEVFGDGTEPLIDNPYISHKELLGLYHTFSLYVMAPKEVYPLIKEAEADTEEAKKLRMKLLSKYNLI